MITLLPLLFIPLTRGHCCSRGSGRNNTCGCILIITVDAGLLLVPVITGHLSTTCLGCAAKAEHPTHSRAALVLHLGAQRRWEVVLLDEDARIALGRTVVAAVAAVVGRVQLLLLLLMLLHRFVHNRSRDHSSRRCVDDIYCC